MGLDELIDQSEMLDFFVQESDLPLDLVRLENDAQDGSAVRNYGQDGGCVRRQQIFENGHLALVQGLLVGRPRQLQLEHCPGQPRLQIKELEELRQE